jgi:hypothetical protein
MRPSDWNLPVLHAPARFAPNDRDPICLDEVKNSNYVLNNKHINDYTIRHLDDKKIG